MDDISVEGISKILRELGYQKHGNECMYNGHTGRPLDSLIFLGPTFYQVGWRIRDGRQLDRSGDMTVAIEIICMICLFSNDKLYLNFKSFHCT